MDNCREFVGSGGKKIRLEANGLTPVRFYMITKKDLLDTLRENFYTELQRAEKVRKFIGMKEEDFLKLKESERNSMYEAYKNLKLGNTQLYYDFTVALIMSADRNLRDHESVLQMIPATWFKKGSEEAEGINELMLSYLLDLEEFQKKNQQ